MTQKNYNETVKVRFFANGCINFWVIATIDIVMALVGITTPHYNVPTHCSWQLNCSLLQNRRTENL